MLYVNEFAKWQFEERKWSNFVTGRSLKRYIEIFNNFNKNDCTNIPVIQESSTVKSSEKSFQNGALIDRPATKDHYAVISPKREKYITRRETEQWINVKYVKPQDRKFGQIFKCSTNIFEVLRKDKIKLVTESIVHLTNKSDKEIWIISPKSNKPEYIGDLIKDEPKVQTCKRPYVKTTQKQQILTTPQTIQPQRYLIKDKQVYRKSRKMPYFKRQPYVKTILDALNLDDHAKFKWLQGDTTLPETELICGKQLRTIAEEEQWTQIYASLQCFSTQEIKHRQCLTSKQSTVNWPYQAKLLKEPPVVYKQEQSDTQIMFQTSTDGLCFMNAFIPITYNDQYFDKNTDNGCRDDNLYLTAYFALMKSYSETRNNQIGHDLRVMRDICKKLMVPLLSLQEFRQTFHSQKQLFSNINAKIKTQEGQVMTFPMIIYNEGHCGILYTNNQFEKYFSYQQLYKNILKNSQPQNSNKQPREAYIVEKKQTNPKTQFTNDQILNYNIRKVLSSTYGIYGTLPQFGPSDGEVCIFVTKYNFNLHKGLTLRLTKLESKFQFITLASLHKKKYPQFFLVHEEKKIVPYKLKDNALICGNMQKNYQVQTKLVDMNAVKILGPDLLLSIHAQSQQVGDIRTDQSYLQLLKYSYPKTVYQITDFMFTQKTTDGEYKVYGNTPLNLSKLVQRWGLSTSVSQSRHSSINHQATPANTTIQDMILCKQVIQMKDSLINPVDFGINVLQILDQQRQRIVYRGRNPLLFCQIIDSIFTVDVGDQVPMIQQRPLPGPNPNGLLQPLAVLEQDFNIETQLAWQNWLEVLNNLDIDCIHKYIWLMQQDQMPQAFDKIRRKLLENGFYRLSVVVACIDDQEVNIYQGAFNTWLRKRVNRLTDIVFEYDQALMFQGGDIGYVDYDQPLQNSVLDHLYMQDQPRYTYFSVFEFCNIPGSYKMPFNEGFYAIQSGQEQPSYNQKTDSLIHIKWNSQKPYRGLNTYISNENNPYKFGWSQIVTGFLRFQRIRVEPQPQFGFNTTNSIQDYYINEQSQALAKGALYTGQQIAASHTQLWTFKDDMDFRFSFQFMDPDNTQDMLFWEETLDTRIRKYITTFVHSRPDKWRWLTIYRLLRHILVYLITVLFWMMLKIEINELYFLVSYGDVQLISYLLQMLYLIICFILHPEWYLGFKFRMVISTQNQTPFISRFQRFHNLMIQIQVPGYARFLDSIKFFASIDYPRSNIIQMTNNENSRLICGKIQDFQHEQKVRIQQEEKLQVISNDMNPEGIAYKMKGSGEGLKLYKQIHNEQLTNNSSLIRNFSDAVKLVKTKQPKISVLICGNQTSIKVDDYYMHKNFRQFCLLNRNMFPGEWFDLVTQQLSYLNEALADFDEPMVIKNQYEWIPARMANDGKQVTLTGSSLVDLGTGNPFKEYEWSSKSIQNSCMSLNRFLNCHTTVNPVDWMKFDDMCDRMFKFIQFDETLIDLTYDLLDYPKDNGFDDNKTKKYFTNIDRFFNDPTYTDLNGTYVHLVKTGEIYSFSSAPNIVNGYLEDRDDRPRGIHAGNNSTCGIFAALQSQIWKVMYKAFPAIAQGLNCEQLKEKIAKQIDETYLTISSDGSAWESTQHWQLIQSVDWRVYEKLLPMFELILSQPLNRGSRNLGDIMDTIKKNLKEQVNTLVFKCFPGLQNHITTEIQPWPKMVNDKFHQTMKDHPSYYAYRTEPHLHFIFYYIKGTQPSGRWETLLMNCIRNVAMTVYYLEEAGYYESWRYWPDEEVITREIPCYQLHDGTVTVQPRYVKNYALQVQGDDNLLHVDSSEAQRIGNKILSLTSRDSKTPDIGLGNIIKEIWYGTFDQFEFCSKWSFSPDGSISQWQMCRDAKNILTKKNYYTGRNKLILENGYLHRLAVFDGLVSDQLSYKLEDISHIQLERIAPGITSDEKRDMMNILTKRLDMDWRNKAFYQGSKTQYKLADYIDYKLGLTVLEVIQTFTDNKIFICGRQNKANIKMNKTLQNQLGTNPEVRNNKKGFGPSHRKLQDLETQKQPDIMIGGRKKGVLSKRVNIRQINNNQKKQKRRIKPQQQQVRIVERVKVIPAAKNSEGHIVNRSEVMPAYCKSVLDPFNSPLIKPPTDFSTITSIAERTRTYTFTADSQSNIQISLFPQNVSHQTAPTLSLFQWQQTDSGTGLSVQSGTSFMQGLDSAPEGTGNWVSCRLVRFGIKIFPLANNMTKQGTLAMCRVPGKIENASMTQSELFNSFPSIDNLLQYPNSVQYSLSNIPPKGYYEYLWLPLDTADLQFIAYRNAGQYFSSDMLYRNPMYIRFTALSAGEKYQIQFREGWEYVPTFGQKAFAPVNTPQARDKDLLKLKDIVGNNKPESIFNGDIGKLIKSAGNQAAKYMMGQGGTMALAGQIINTGLTFAG